MLLGSWSRYENTGLRVVDLPKATSGIMDSLQRVGNEVSKGISKVAGERATAIKKVISADTSPPQEK